MRSSKWFLKALIGVIVPVSLLLGVTAPANAAEERHFMFIVAKGAARWTADAQLYTDNGGTRVYAWKQNWRTGGRALWKFTWRGRPGEYIDFHLTGVTAAGPATWSGRLNRLDRDHCYLVTAAGVPRYTGDSVTGGCNDK